MGVSVASTTTTESPLPAVVWGEDCVVKVVSELTDASTVDATDSSLYEIARSTLFRLETARSINQINCVASLVSDVVRNYTNSRLLDRVVHIAKYLSHRDWNHRRSGINRSEIYRFLDPVELCAALGWLDALQFYTRVVPATPWVASLARLYHRRDIVDYLHQIGIDPISVDLTDCVVTTEEYGAGTIPRFHDLMLSMESIDPVTSVQFTPSSSSSGYGPVFEFRGKHVFDTPFPLVAAPFGPPEVSVPVRVQVASFKDYNVGQAYTKKCTKGVIETLQCYDGSTVYDFAVGIAAVYFFPEKDPLCPYRHITYFNRIQGGTHDPDLLRILT